MNTDNVLKEIGRSYIVSAFLPSAFFVSLAILLFRGFVPRMALWQFKTNSPFPEQQWLLILFVIFWVAFFLYSANDVTVKLFEGYFIPEALSDMITNSLKEVWDEKFKVHLNSYLEIRDWSPTSDKTQSQKIAKEFGKRYRLALQEQQELGITGPFESANLLPTRLGRVLRASEVYANERYMMEELVIWPRLIPTLPKSIAAVLEEKHNHLMFLLNSALLIFINAVISFFVGIMGVFCFIDPIKSVCLSIVGGENFFFIGYDFINPLGYFALSLAMATFGYVLYSIGVNVAQEMGMYIQSSYDLYRLNVLRQMNIPLPENLSDERDTWQDICTFLISGTRIKDLEKMPVFSKYVYPKMDNSVVEEDTDSYYQPE